VKSKEAQKSHQVSAVIPRWSCVVSHTRGRAENPRFKQVGTRELLLRITLLTLDIFKLILKPLSLLSIIPVL